MRRLIAAEVAKLFTTKLWLWLLLASMALTALYVSLSIAFGDSPDNPTPLLSSPQGQPRCSRSPPADQAHCSPCWQPSVASTGLTVEFAVPWVALSYCPVRHSSLL